MKTTPNALKNTLSFFLIVVFCISQINAQRQNLKEKTLSRFGFKEYAISTQNDTIFFYWHQKPNVQPDKIVIYLQGTTPIPDPFFEVEQTKDGNNYYQYFSSDYELLNNEYAYILIGLPGVPAVKNQGTLDLKKYNALNSLDYRVHNADRVINYIHNNFFEPKKVIVYGHSEGAFVAPKLATVNKKITHLGVWGGSALPDFFDFIMFERKAYLKGQQSDSITQKNISAIIRQFKDISKDSLNTVPSNENEISEYTNKRWWSYAEPTINHLVNLDIPIYVQLGSEDESAPIESNYIIPLEFARLGKQNLTFNVCVGCDHGFVNVKTKKDYWPSIFKDFMNWTTQKNNALRCN